MSELSSDSLHQISGDRRFSGDESRGVHRKDSKPTSFPSLDNAEPHQFLEALAGSHNTDYLDKLAQQASEKKWGVIQSEDDIKHCLDIWSNDMTTWFQNLGFYDASLQRDAADILDHLGCVDVDSNGRRIIRWEAFHTLISKDGRLKPELFVERIKEIPGIKNKVKAAELLSGVFGKEVVRELFGRHYTEYERHESDCQRTKGVIEKAHRRGEISDEKRDRLLQKADKRADSIERILNGIIYDPKLTREQREKVRESLRHIPGDLLKAVERVKVGKDTFAAMMYHSFAQGSGVLEIDPAGMSLEGGEFAKVVFHEIMGHGLRWMSGHIDKEADDQIRELWAGVPQRLIEKDSYAWRYADGDLKKRNWDRRGISAAVDEFWSDRMAEWYYKRIFGTKIESHRHYDKPFTQKEEAYVERVCGETFKAWEQGMVRYKRRLALKDTTLLGKVRKSFFGDALNPRERRRLAA